jgi:hypothetical protein
MKCVSGQAEIAETCVYGCQTSVASCIFQSVMLVGCKLQLFPLLSMWGNVRATQTCLYQTLKHCTHQKGLQPSIQGKVSVSRARRQVHFFTCSQQQTMPAQFQADHLNSSIILFSGYKPTHALKVFSSIALCLDRALTTGVPSGTRGALAK